MKMRMLPLILVAFSFCGSESTLKPLTPEQKYFLKVALGTELGSASHLIRKWNTDLNIFIPDSSNTMLVSEFNSIKSEINALSKSIKLKRVMTEDEANFVIFFSDKDSYGDYEPGAKPYLSGNYGLFWFYWNGSNALYKGSMYVDIERTTDDNCKRHLLREELTQSLGLATDTDDYSNSIFYQPWTCTTSYADIDKKLIEYILNPEITAGMNEEQATQVLRKID